MPPELLGRDLRESAPYLNLARNAQLDVSGSPDPGAAADRAVDGDPESPWIGGEAPQFFTVMFDGPRVVRKICFRVFQEVPGRTLHRVEMRFGTRWREVHVFEGFTRRGDQLVLDPETPWEGVTAVRVVTDVAPSAVGWLEVGVYGP